jgi:hypothetical protein
MGHIIWDLLLIYDKCIGLTVTLAYRDLKVLTEHLETCVQETENLSEHSKK